MIKFDFEIDDEQTEKVFKKLREYFETEDNLEVIQKALAMLDLTVNNSSSDNVFIYINSKGDLESLTLKD